MTTTFLRKWEYLRKDLNQAFRYFIIGALMAILDLILLFLLVEIFNVWYLHAAVIAFTIIVTAGFILQKNFTFKFYGSNLKTRYLFFIFIAGSGIFWEILFLFIFVEILNFWYLIGAIITKFIVFGWNFLLNKFFTFGSYSNEIWRNKFVSFSRLLLLKFQIKQ